MDRTFWRTVLKVEVLSEDKPLTDASLAEIEYAITDGDCSGVVRVESVKELSPKQAAKALVAQGSDPEFFLLDEEGNEIEE